MTVKQILNLDCREEFGQEKLQEALWLIKPLKKYSGNLEKKVPFSKVEKVITILSKKYNFRVREFVADVWANDEETIWRATIINDNDLSTMQLVYGISVYEVFAKVAVYMYGKKDVVGIR